MEAQRATVCQPEQNSASGEIKSPNWRNYFESEVEGVTPQRIADILKDFDNFGKFIEKLNRK